MKLKSLFPDAIFYLLVTLMLPTKFQVNCTPLPTPYDPGEEVKIDFQDGRHGGHLGFPIRRILAIFDHQVTPMLPTKFPVNRLWGPLAGPLCR